MDKLVTWSFYLMLNELFFNKSVNYSKSNDFINYLAETGRIEIEKNKILAKSSYKIFYEETIKQEFEKFNAFLIKFSISDLCKNLTIYDIENLIRLHEQSIFVIDSQLTRKQILSRFFLHSKYKKQNLENAILQVLDVNNFIDDTKEQQFLSIYHSKEPAKIILLCENSDRLVNPRQKYTEIWYAGGKNTLKLDFVPKPKLPIFYLCDWDFDGLNIYSHIKKHYFATIELIKPSNYKELAKNIIETEHKSIWKNSFNMDLLTEEEKLIVNFLKPNLWIEEESISYNENIEIIE